MRTQMFWIVVVLFAVACSGKKDKPDETNKPSGSQVATAPPKSDGVAVFVDGQTIATIPMADLAKWPRLDSLLPDADRRLGTWQALTFKPAGGTLEKPSTNHPDRVPVVFPNRDGKPAFGMFDSVELANKGTPAFRAEGFSEIHITLSKTERSGSHQGTGEISDPTKLVLKITTPEGDKQLTGPEILKLPRIPQPNQEDAKGWSLIALLEAAGVTKFNAVTLIGSSGSLPFEKKELDPAKVLPFVKLNKSGQLRFRMYAKQGEGWQSGADLREMTSIQVK